MVGPRPRSDFAFALSRTLKVSAAYEGLGASKQDIVIRLRAVSSLTPPAGQSLLPSIFFGIGACTKGSNS